MNRGRIILVACLILPALGGGRVSSQAPAALDVPGADSRPALSPRNASYRIAARLDPAARMLEGRQTLHWRNVTDVPAHELRFHLYWNAWRNDRSTWMLEERLEDVDEVREEDWGWTVVDAIRLPAADLGRPLDLTGRAEHVSPDDGNPYDRTVLRVPLPRPVAPGETLAIEIDWRSRIPRTFARTGTVGDFFFIAHWFPKLGVFEGADGWAAHQFHAATEFYSDYGVYDVSITLPARFVVGATGQRIERSGLGDGTAVHRFRAEDVHGFAWTASPAFVEYRDRFEHPGLPPVEIRLLMQPEHRGQADRHLAATRAALASFGTWYGPYPYGYLTVVDPAWNSGAGGMEYPTLFTAGTRLLTPARSGSPEGVTIHETGHQFWYGIVGNDEFEHAWIDEGLTTFSTIRTMEAAYPPRLLSRRYLSPPRGGDGFLPVVFDGIEHPPWDRRIARYRRFAHADSPETPTYRHYPPTAAAITYDKTALWLGTLERHLGWPTLQRILSTFFRRFAFAHPGPADFVAVAEEVAGRDLDWFFDQVLRDAVVFDYAVREVSSVPVAPRGFVEGPGGELVHVERGATADRAGAGEDATATAAGATETAGTADAEPLWRSEVVVERRGGGRFPVSVLLVFDDGVEVAHRWDGRQAWTSFVVERPARLRHAVVDPNHVLMLDVRRTNNSRVLRPDARLAAWKWAAKWMGWFQERMWAFAFFV